MFKANIFISERNQNHDSRTSEFEIQACFLHFSSTVIGRDEPIRKAHVRPSHCLGRASEVCFVNATRHLRLRLCNDHSSAPRLLPFSHTNFDNRFFPSHNAVNPSTPSYHSNICNAFRSAHTQRSIHKAYLSTSCLQLLGSALIMSTCTQNENCPLLDLPVETLQRITGLLDPHGDLPVVRRTCKTLDQVSLDQFVNASFSNIKCCIFSEARWLRLKEILGGPSRITSKIRNVELTTHLFDRREKNELEILLDDLDDDYWDHHHLGMAGDVLLHEESKAKRVHNRPNLALMSRVIREMQTVLPPRTLTLDLIQNLSSSNPYIQAHLDALLTLVFTRARVNIEDLALNEDASAGLSGNFVHLRQDMLRCTSELKTFRLSPGRSDNVIDMGERYLRDATAKPLDQLYEILRSANELRVLDANMYTFGRWRRATLMAQDLLESTVSREITSLTLKNMLVKERFLLEALSRWAPNLLTLSLGNITLEEVRGRWPAVLRALSAMPQLKHLELLSLCVQYAGLRDPLVVKLVSNVGDSLQARVSNFGDSLQARGRCKCEGRSEVLSGLEELLTGPFTYHD